MPRLKNPLGDPVSVQKRGKFLDIRYFPNGVVGDPSERRWLNAKFPLDTAEEVIQTVAGQRRTSLIAYRSTHRQDKVDELGAVTTREAVDALGLGLELFLCFRTGVMRRHELVLSRPPRRMSATCSGCPHSFRCPYMIMSTSADM